ncbi:hypothetical protein N0V82_001039 [Gnomoniopsis sp. IMI 355080]|nr:hypothetical protein N0V82_001039 [Gnomoniopsis sp. IMI 355080]
MQFSFSLLQFGLLLASVVAGQLGGGPNAGAGAGWDVDWKDTTIRQPTDFEATPLGNDAYTVTFSRDTKDNKYQLSYWITYGSGESSGQEETGAVDLAYVGSPDASGFQTYSARLPNAKSERFTTATNGVEIYFTPKDTSEIGYVITTPISK